VEAESLCDHVIVNHVVDDIMRYVPGDDGSVSTIGTYRT